VHFQPGSWRSGRRALTRSRLPGLARSYSRVRSPTSTSSCPPNGSWRSCAHDVARSRWLIKCGCNELHIVWSGSNSREGPTLENAVAILVQLAAIASASCLYRQRRRQGYFVERGHPALGILLSTVPPRHRRAAGRASFKVAALTPVLPFGNKARASDFSNDQPKTPRGLPDQFRDSFVRCSHRNVPSAIGHRNAFFVSQLAHRMSVRHSGRRVSSTSSARFTSSGFTGCRC